MEISALLTAAGVNIAICTVLLSLYSILRKQPSTFCVYFGQKLARVRSKRHEHHFSFDRLVPSPSWLVKAWETTEEDLLAIGGLDAVVFLRVIVFSIRIFSIASTVCIFLVLPLNYFGKEMQHKLIPSESLEVFTIENVHEGSKWLWAHCLALYIISCSACVLLYFEYKSITNMRMTHINGSPMNPSHFTVLVRGIPRSSEESYSDSVEKFFSDYYATSYLSHQVVYQSGMVQKLMNDAVKMYKVLKSSNGKHLGSGLRLCGLCGGTSTSFKKLSSESESTRGRSDFRDLDFREKECAAALVFFKTRYDALVASAVLQSSNPMLWVTELAPEPHDVYWKNLCIPYRQLWIRKIATLLAAVLFMLVFLLPVTFVQGLLALEGLQKRFPSMRRFLEKKFIMRLVTGYLPSVVLTLFLYAVPPIMMLFSTLEGPISRSGRKKSACCKILYFTIWNVFFANVFSGTVINNLTFFSNPKDLPTLLARAVPAQGAFFMTYVMSSGWASLCSELMQPFGLLYNFVNRVFLRKTDDHYYGTLSFPYHTEIPRLLLFGLLGFTCSILAPLILPLLLVYYFLAYLVYRNQILNVYITKYQSGGQFWPIVHHTTIFTLVLTQIMALGVFGLKRSSVASGFTIPLIILTLLFNEYCRQRFTPIFKKAAAQVLIEMDRQDEQCGRMGEIHQQLHSSFCQFASMYNDSCEAVHLNHHDDGNSGRVRDPEGRKSGLNVERARENLYLESDK